MDDQTAKNLRLATPIILGILTILTSVLIAVVNNLSTEIRAVRLEVSESRKFSVQYTDKMIELVLIAGGKKKAGGG